MSSVAKLPRGILMTANQLAEETGLARETVVKRLTDASVTAVGQRRGYPVFRLRQALPAVLQLDQDHSDPSSLDPYKRRAFYQAEIEKLDLETREGLLVPFAELEYTLAKVMKAFVNAFETAPDVVERDCGVSPAVVDRLDKHFNARRLELYEILTGHLPQPEEPSENSA